MKIILPLLLLLSAASVQSQTVSVTGRFFYDANGNQVFDGTDSVIANKQVYAQYSTGVYNTFTNASGQYAFSLPLGSYNIGHYGSIATQNYIDTGDQYRVYTAAGSDIVNFAYQKRDSVESVLSAFGYFPNDDIPPSGATKQYKLEYGYDGFLQNMPASVIVKYNPKLTVVNTSIPPAVNTPGTLQWNFANVQRNVFYNSPVDSILITFSFPAAGDTIGGYRLVPSFTPGITINKPYDRIFHTGFQNIEYPPHNPIGTSSGVKWLRHFYSSIPSFNSDEAIAIDTTQNGNGYFMGGQKVLEDTSNQFNRSWPFIAKLNKDGLSIWEKHFDTLNSSQDNYRLAGLTHTPDGGCIMVADFNQHDSSFYFIDEGIYIAKYDSSGNKLWTKILNGSKYDYAGRDIVVLPDGSFFITGTTASKDGDFANNHPDSLTDNIFISKLSANGNLIFTKVFGGSDYEFGYGLKLLQNGTLLLMATTLSNDGDVSGAHQHFVIDPITNDTTYNEEAWLLNIDGNGNKIWSKCYGGRKFSYLVGAAENGAGLLLTGFTDSKDGDLPYYPESFVPLWALQISPANGNIIWSKLHKLYNGYQDTNYIYFPDEIYDNYTSTRLHKTKDGNFIVGGAFSSKYGVINGKHGEADYGIIKLNPTGDIIWQKALGGTKGDHINDIQLDNKDDIVFAGSSYSDNDDLYQHTQPFQGLMVVGKMGITNVIKGHVFVDLNGNHIKDGSEPFYSQGRVMSIKGTDTTQARIFNGIYLNNVDTGSYTTIYKPVNNYYTIFPATHTSNFPTFDLQDSLDISLVPIPNINDLEVELISLTPPRPGFNAAYRVITKNVGTTTINNVVINFFKDPRQTFFDASRPVAGGINDSIWWPPFTLNAFETDTLDITLTQNTPPLLNVNDTISLRAVAEPVAGDSSENNNTALMRQVVRGSFDPNDKSERHAGTLTTTQYAGGEFLQYLIRFQNTGTDTAFFVTVKDTLQANLDLNTLETISASHPFTFRMNGNIATWDFKMILLPDSITDEPNSHGYISFKIKPKTGLAVGDVFTNSAGIYFDFNLPVITNRDNTVIGSNTGVCPNGNVSFEAGIAGTTYQWQVNNGSGYTNLSNTGIYSGVNTATLSLTGASTALYGNKYRCIVNGSIISPENTLRFAVQWTGAGDTNWNNPLNWDCGELPDAKTEVIIPESVNYPVVSSTAFCYSLRLSPGSTVTVSPGFNLTITGKPN